MVSTTLHHVATSELASRLEHPTNGRRQINRRARLACATPHTRSPLRQYAVTAELRLAGIARAVRRDVGVEARVVRRIAGLIRAARSRQRREQHRPCRDVPAFPLLPPLVLIERRLQDPLTFQAPWCRSLHGFELGHEYQEAMLAHNPSEPFASLGWFRDNGAITALSKFGGANPSNCVIVHEPGVRCVSLAWLLPALRLPDQS